MSPQESEKLVVDETIFLDCYYQLSVESTQNHEFSLAR